MYVRIILFTFPVLSLFWILRTLKLIIIKDSIIDLRLIHILQDNQKEFINNIYLLKPLGLSLFLVLCFYKKYPPGEVREKKQTHVTINMKYTPSKISQKNTQLGNSRRKKVNRTPITIIHTFSHSLCLLHLHSLFRRCLPIFIANSFASRY